jgi:arylsulfatase A-like enzyme
MSTRRLRLILFALSVSCSLVVAAGLAGAAQARPNILFIVTDDQSLAGTMAAMPNTKRWFQDQGIAFPKAVATTPTCCPSRTSIFTGRYSHNTGITDNNKAICMGTTEGLTTGPDAAGEDCGYTTAVPNPQLTTVQHYLQQAGYRTAIYGKYLNEWPLDKNPPFFNDWAIQNNSQYTPSDFNNQGIRQWVWEYTPNYIAREARDFIQRARDQNPDQPWFLYIAPESPHSPFFPEQKYADTSTPPFAPDSNSFLERDLKDKPLWVQQTIGSSVGGLSDEDFLRHDWAEHMRMLRTTDDLVESVMQKLHSLGEDQNTLAFFISDNGFLWGEHGLRTKLKPYLESVQVPLFMRWPAWPGNSNGATSDWLVGNVDLAPTALTSAGIDPTALDTQMDGGSLLDLSAQARTNNLTEAWLADTPRAGVFPTWAAIQTPTFHYIESYQTVRNPDGTVQSEQVIFREYYDLVHDPAELNNLVGDSDPKNDPPTAELSARLAADRACAGRTCPNRESVATAYFPADTAITEKPESVSGARRGVRFSFTSTEPDSTFRCKLNRNRWRTCGSTTTFYTGINGGNNTILVRSDSPRGNDDDTPASYKWRVDYSPDTRLNTVPPGISTSRNATFTFESANQQSFECALDTPTATGTFGPCTSPKAYTGLADGNYKFYVRAFDAVSGERDPHPQTHSWSIDATPPETQVRPDEYVCQPAVTGTMVTCPNTVRGSSMTLFLTTSEAPAERFECQLDSGPYRVCGGIKTYTRLPSGMHTVSVRARDLAGNTDPTPATLGWQIGSLQSFATAPDTSWPQIIDGTVVKSVVHDGAGGWYVGGDFTTVGLPGAPSAHTDLVHINADHSIDELWNPATGDGEVRTLNRVGSVLYVGGTFTSMKGTTDTTFTTRNRLAAISLTGTTKGQLTSWDPNADGSVNVLAWSPKRVAGTIVNTIYVGGAFSSVHGVARDKVVELDLTEGIPTSWGPTIGGTNVLALVVTFQAATDCGQGNCGYVYVGGAPNLLAEIDRGGSGTVTGWRPSPNGVVRALRIQGDVGRLPTIYAGGSFTQIGTPAAPRNHVAELNLSDDGSPTPWDPSVGSGGLSGQVLALMPFHCSQAFSATPTREPPCMVVVAGGFDTMKIGTAGATTRNRLAETDVVTGDVNDWNPNLNAAVSALACYPASCQTAAPDPLGMLAPNRILAVGGQFTTVGGMLGPKGLAFFPASQ